MDPNSQYLEACWALPPDGPNRQTALEFLPDALFVQRFIITDQFVPEIIGFTVYTIVFVPSLQISLLCLYYLFKNRKGHLHVAVIGFSIIISFFNLATFVLKSAAIITHVRSSTCPSSLSTILAFSIGDDSLGYIFTSLLISNGLVPTFLWISDAFLLYRAWVVWIGHRRYTLLPGMVLLTSIVTGILWLVQSSDPVLNGLTIYTQLFNAVGRWVPALGFSVGLDTLTTGMIAGRLIYHHRMQKKLGGTHTSPYLPVVTIFIESAALSLISKIIQISIPSPAITYNPLIIPLCTISSNLIILRKALGLSAFSTPVRDAPHLPTIQFKSQNSQSHLGTSWVGLETLVIQGVGGNPEVRGNVLDTSNSNSGTHSEQN